MIQEGGENTVNHTTDPDVITLISPHWRSREIRVLEKEHRGMSAVCPVQQYISYPFLYHRTKNMPLCWCILHARGFLEDLDTT